MVSQLEPPVSQLPAPMVVSRASPLNFHSTDHFQYPARILKACRIPKVIGVAELNGLARKTATETLKPMEVQLEYSHSCWYIVTDRGLELNTDIHFSG